MSKHFAAAANTDPLPFTVGDDPYEFFATAQAPAAALLKIAAASASDDEDGANVMQATVDFLDSVLLEASREKFAERMSSADSPITLAQIGEIVKWLVEEYAGRPTDSPSPSPAGQSDNGDNSTVSSPSTVSTS